MSRHLDNYFYLYIFSPKCHKTVVKHHVFCVILYLMPTCTQPQYNSIYANLCIKNAYMQKLYIPAYMQNQIKTLSIKEPVLLKKHF